MSDYIASPKVPSSLYRKLADMLKGSGAWRSLKEASEAASLVLNYLVNFGFIDSRTEDISLKVIHDAVKAFQRFFGLKANGTIDVKTIRTMTQPRCGHPDICRDGHTEEIKVRQFVRKNLAAWKKRDLTYTFKSYVPGLGKTPQTEMMIKAVDSWVSHIKLRARLVRGSNADIVIDTGRGRRDGFDGARGVLAWAQLPPGDDRRLLLKFDVDERWSDSPRGRGIYYLAVAAHEFGHILGLTHSRVASALMAPTYNPAVWSPQQNDDILRAIARYGEREGGNTPGTGGDDNDGDSGAETTIKIKYWGDGEILVNGKAVV